FFFQAEDGIRDSSVTGVQTCALPICKALDTAGVYDCRAGPPEARDDACCFCQGVVRDGEHDDVGAGDRRRVVVPAQQRDHVVARSEERRVGKEWSGWGGGGGGGSQLW